MRVLITSMAAAGLVGLAIGTALLGNEPTIDEISTGSIELLGDRLVGKSQINDMSDVWSSWKFRNSQSALAQTRTDR
jgi:pyruvate/2-oxoglutarate/acetoin dehydrogenase E1 component